MKTVKYIIILTLICRLSTLTTVTAFAGDTAPYDHEIVANDTRNNEQTSSISTDIEEPVITYGEPLTPNGNLTLVDDIETENEIDKQFITAVTKNGNYFYLVIDRSSDSDNVYLLNMVDEADLMALMEETPTEVPKEPEPVPEPLPEETTEPTKEESSSNALPLFLAIILLGGGGAFYYFKFVKNKEKGGANDLSEFADDDDYDDDKYSLEDVFGEDISEEDLEENEQY